MLTEGVAFVISLIVATKGRVEPLARLLDSLCAQSSSDFEVLIVDQNMDDRLGNIVRKVGSTLSLSHLKSAPGASRARNLGARYARGNILGFPDDDCWYPPDLVARVADWFLDHLDAAALSGRPYDPDAQRYVFPFSSIALRIELPMVADTVAAPALFIRTPSFLEIGGFDELMGPGADTRFGGMEEHEICLRMLDAGEHLEYDPAFVVYHPLIGQSITPAKARGYAGGMARIATLYPGVRPTVAFRIVRSLGGMILRAFQLRLSDARNHWNAAIGYWLAYWATRRQIRETPKRDVCAEERPWTELHALCDPGLFRSRRRSSSDENQFRAMSPSGSGGALVRLGVVIPTRNRPARVRTLLENLSSQTRLPDTVVVVDGSDPALKCENVVKEFRERLPAVEYVGHHPPSAAAQRNVGLERVISHVDLVAFIDDDVILHGDALETACAGIAVAGSEFAGFGLNPVDERAAREYGKLRDSRLAEKLGLYSSEVCAVSPSGWHTRPVTVDKDTEVQWLPTGAVIWRVDTVREVRFDEYFLEYSYLEDLDFSLQARKRGRMKLLANVCYEHDPAPEGRKSRFWFGRIEVRNRQYIVRKHRLSQPRFVLGLAIRVGLTFVDVVRGRWSEAGRLVGNLYEIPRSIIPHKGQPSRRHERVGNRS